MLTENLEMGAKGGEHINLQVVHGIVNISMMIIKSGAAKGAIGL